MKKLLIAVVLAFAVWSAPAPGYCWDGVAHMLISQIAYDRLTPAAKAQVDLLAQALNNDSLTSQLSPDLQECTPVTVAAWPDDIKSLYSETRQFSPWHFIDLDSLPASGVVVWRNGHPETPSVDDSAIGSVKRFGDPAVSDVYLQIIAQSAVLKDKNAALADRARALAFVEHFVGDIHQPLHCIGRQLGGNRYVINPLPGADPDWKIDNLHSFWDNSYRYDIVGGQITVNPLLQTPRQSAPDTGTIKSWADEIEADYLPHDPSVLSQTDPAAWAVESNRIATVFAFPSDNSPSLSNEYISEASKIARTRLALAGYRLGNLLNSLFSK
jgi:hypothetical protein